MLHLNARIHLDEIQLAVFVHKELDRSCIHISDIGKRLAQHLPDFLPQLRRDLRRRRFLEQLLVPPLDAALAFAEARHGSVLIGENLKFDVARVFHILFHVEITVAECRCSF